MNPKAKKLTTGALVLTAVAIWIPQLMTGIVRKPAEPRQEIDDWTKDGDASENNLSHQISELGPEQFPEIDGRGEEQRNNSALEPGSLAEQLIATSQQVRTLAGAGRVDLDQLLQSLQATPSTSAPSNAPVHQEGDPREAQAPMTLLAGDGGTLMPTLRSPLAEFELDLTLNAILLGKSDSLALLGDELVRVGDELSGGVLVAEIQARRVKLEQRGNARWLSLPPLRVRPASTSNDSSVGEESQAESDDLYESSPSTSKPARQAGSRPAAPDEVLKPLEESREPSNATADGVNPKENE